MKRTIVEPLNRLGRVPEAGMLLLKEENAAFRIA